MLRKYLTIALLRTGTRLCGLNIFGMRKWMREANQWPAQAREQWRLKRLGDILEFAWKEVPFYRQFWGDHGIDFRRPRELEELQGYPVLTKQLFRENSERIRPSNISTIRHIRKCTGGSTSVPVNYLVDIEQWCMMEAFHLWGWQQAGYEPGDAVGVIAGGSLERSRMTLRSRVRSFAQRRLFLYGVAMDRGMAREYHQRLVGYRAEFLYGYPSVLYLFAKFLHEENLSLPQLKAVVTTAEMLLPHYRKGIEEWLNCPVFNDYGSNDGGIESYECARHQGFHYNDLQSVLEVKSADGQTPEGPLLITNLWNRSTPFIRYENGDIARLAARSCPCGSPFPLIASVEGRTTDIVTFGNGRSLSGPALTLIFGDMKIDGWQIVQTGALSLEVRLRSSTELPVEYIDRIKRIISHHAGPAVALNIIRVDQLTLTKAGKLKPVICDVPA